MAEFIETIVIGAGQAGLAMSHHLAQRGREHVLLERARIAERWRSERWDSLYFQFPNRMMRLPGHAYAGDDPDGFTHRDGVVRFITDYAMRNAAPVRCGIEVTALRRADNGRLRIETGAFAMEAANVVVATGPYQVPKVPPAAAGLPPGIQQVTANRYTNPGELPPGGVLVVGSGASGFQIVEDLLQQGRRVHYALRGHRRVPRSYRGRDFGIWNEQSGFTSRVARTIPPGFRPPLVTGHKGGHTANVRRLVQRGVTLLGSLRGIEDGRVFLNADLNASLDAGDEDFRATLREIDAYVEREGIDAPRDEAAEAEARTIGERVPEVEALDLASAGITSVVWALGYGVDFGWIACPVRDERATLIHDRGITREPGLLFLGLPRMHKIKSAFLWGVGEDAEHLAEHIAGRG
ncbi:flavin-containing monooxygenase [Neoroseomonas soli]|uniref:NAD(P)-binding domain-containing protein n=1 Tax=Neoroseomonas soli TaxID=1081025 RepID=A0A9X9WUG9_9PROT|nr:NAD(P)/FAD-dependent oxidoreductase [Neoroseomonas soli]MBR0670798.1 NAD(P)-binding domain-containing protein [Neoroseomonas soli]